MKEKPMSEKRLSQKERFLEGAKHLEIDESSEKFEELFSRLVPPKRPGKDE